jgi:hypothetical protein
MGVMGFASRISGADVVLAGAFLGRAALEGFAFGVVAGLFLVAMRVKLSGHLK